ncbi:MAG: hypothetical protein CL610_21455 [Anaerolineaceae bacterium]|nr:hypothetical protein [Anaerolineaceae bacterium]
MRKYIVLLGLLIVNMGLTGPAFACSGGVTSTVDMLVENAEVIVYGELLNVDDAGQNAVMRADSYVAGGPGPQHIVLSLYEPARVHHSRERFSGGGCFYGVSPLLEPAQEILIFLTRKLDGGYQLAPRHFSNPDYYPFPTDQSTVTVHVDTNPTDDTPAEARDVTLDQFTALIRDAAGTGPTEPHTDATYPLLAPLLITTESGTHYLLPVDGADPVIVTDEDWLFRLRRHKPACWQTDCKAWSPNGIDQAALSTDGIITMTYGAPIPGEALLFSATSDAMAIWQRTPDGIQLQIHTLMYRRLNAMQDDNVALFQTFDLELEQIAPESAAWSPDGRMLAFRDDRGVWLWDALNPDAEPELLTDVPQPIRGFSPMGRYLVLGEGSAGYSLDLVTGEHLPPGLFSADDRLLLTYEPAFQLIQLTPYFANDNQPPVGDQVLKAAWKDSHTYITLICPDATDQTRCRVLSQGQIMIEGNGIYPGYDFAYEAQTNMLAIVKDPQTITLQINRPYGVYDRELGDILDGPIRTVEWLPALFWEKP